MVYLFGGPPRCGKTTLAEAFSKAHGIPYVPLDYVMSTILPYVSDFDWDRMFPLRTYREETQWSNDALYAKCSPQEVVNSYVCEAESTWAGVRNFITYALSEKRDFILEGFQLLPRLIHEFDTPENHAELKPFFIYKTNVDAILAGMKANAAGNDWAVKNTTEDKTLVSIAEMVSLFGKYIERECKQYGLPSASMDVDFKQKMISLVESFTREI